MSNPNPPDGGSETVNITSNQPSKSLTVTAHYKTTTHQFPGNTDGAGNSSVTFDIGHPTVGYTVVVDVDISGGAHCETSFTPHQ